MTERMIDRMNTGLNSLSPSGIRRFTALARAQKDCAMLTIGEPDFDTPEPIKQAAVRALGRNRTHYPQNAGDPDVRTAVAEFERASRGLDYAPDEIILTCGASEAIYTAMTGVLNPGDEVIVPQPAFGLYDSIARLSGARVVPLDTAKTGFQPDAAALEACITPRTKLIVVNSPNNPTGAIYSAGSLATVRDAALRHKLFVLSDDVYLGLSYAPCPTLAALGGLRDRLLAVQSFSKPYAMTGWRLGYLMSDRALIDRLKLLHAAAVVSVAAYAQDACIEALRTDVAPLRETYRARRDLICARLDEAGLPYVRPEGAFYVFPSIREFGLDSETFCLRMIREGGLAAVPGSCFGAEGHIRLSYCYSTDEIERAMDRLCAFVRRLRA